MCFEDVSVSSRVHHVKYDNGSTVRTAFEQSQGLCHLRPILAAWIASDTSVQPWRPGVLIIPTFSRTDRSGDRSK
jgi:hypothetical protein